jgi:hypothetical protein
MVDPILVPDATPYLQVNAIGAIADFKAEIDMLETSKMQRRSRSRSIIIPCF